MRTIRHAAILYMLALPFAPLGVTQGPDEDYLAATNVCNAINTEIVRAPGAKISVNIGEYKIDGANGSITISRGPKPVITGYTYDAYVNCVTIIGNNIAKTRKQSRMIKNLEILEVAE